MATIEVGSDLLTVEQFLKLPEFKPAMEFFEGRAIQKISPRIPHCIIEPDLCAALNQFARPRRLGRAFSELRCTFGGSSLVFDLSFFVRDRTPRFVRKGAIPDVTRTPDLAVEIMSPGQGVGELTARLLFAIEHGLQLGWLIHPTREEVSILRPGLPVEVVRSGDLLTGEDVLPGFALPIVEMFGWLDED